MKSLIIEDDHTTRTILQKWMSEYGKCSSYSNGEEGSEAFEISLNSGHPYDLICLDICMPGINGHETLERIRGQEKAMGIKTGKGCKVLMVTANNDSENVLKAFKGECDGYLAKPLSKSKLVTQLKTFGFRLD
jgi:two-component system chemotaxis response regulator CheY